MTIREARAEDADGLRDLLAELGYPDGSAAVVARVRALIHDPASFLLVAEDEDGLTGLASATCMPLLHEGVAGAASRRSSSRSGAGGEASAALSSKGSRRAPARWAAATSK